MFVALTNTKMNGCPSRTWDTYCDSQEDAALQAMRQNWVRLFEDGGEEDTLTRTEMFSILCEFSENIDELRALRRDGKNVTAFVDAMLAMWTTPELLQLEEEAVAAYNLSQEEECN